MFFNSYDLFVCFSLSSTQLSSKLTFDPILIKSCFPPSNRSMEPHERRLRAISCNMTEPNYPGDLLIPFLGVTKRNVFFQFSNMKKSMSGNLI